MFGGRTVRWCIYYDDDTEYTSEDGDPFDAPKKHSAIAFGQLSKKSNWEVKGGDFLVHRTDKDRWYAADIHGLVDHVKYFAIHVDAVLEGRTLTNEEFNSIIIRAKHDPRVPTPSRVNTC